MIRNTARRKITLPYDKEYSPKEKHASLKEGMPPKRKARFLMMRKSTQRKIEFPQNKERSPKEKRASSR